MANDGGAARLLDAFDRQAAFCRQPSPFTARLLDRGRLWLQRDADARAALAAVAADPHDAAVPLRWAGALHHLALLGLQPWAALWPSAAAAATPGDDSGTAGDDGSAAPVAPQVGRPVPDGALDAAIAAAWSAQRQRVAAALALPPQTNEVQRSAALLPGLLFVARQTGGMPLALLEIGASAGLNLWPERHRHDHGVWQWGDPAAALALHSDWRGPAPGGQPVARRGAHAAADAAADARGAALRNADAQAADARRRPCPTALQIVSRAGCDANPVDIRQPAEALRLASFVWPDQFDRLARLNTALHETARWMAADGVAVRAEAARDFVARELASPRPGVATLLMHSVVWQYIAADEQASIDAAVRAAGARATAAAPLAWLRFEPPSPKAPMALRCRLWPPPAARGNRCGSDDGDDRSSDGNGNGNGDGDSECDSDDHLLAIVHPHAAWIDWRGP